MRMSGRARSTPGARARAGAEAVDHGVFDPLLGEVGVEVGQGAALDGRGHLDRQRARDEQVVFPGKLEDALVELVRRGHRAGVQVQQHATRHP